MGIKGAGGLRLAVRFFVAALASIGLPQVVCAEPVTITAKMIDQFKRGVDDPRFGHLQFLGGIEYSSANPRVQSLSAIRFRPDGRHFVGVLDSGDWMTGEIVRNGAGKISGLSGVRVDEIGLAGGLRHTKRNSDAEGLALRPGEAIVSFEERHRIDVYPDPGFETARPLRSLDFLIPSSSIPTNSGFETLVAAPREGRFHGALIAITEESLDEAGNMRAAILDGPLKGRFAVVRHAPFDATDAAFLPNGDMLLLERRFSLFGGLGMRIRRIKGDSIRPGAVVDGEVLLDADMSDEIDNMEGMDVIAGADGRPHIILVSDDNAFPLERNLMLEFRLDD